jgi:hypothetical protein
MRRYPLLGPVRTVSSEEWLRSWVGVGLGVVRGVQLGPWLLWGRWVRWPVTPTGTGAGWLLCPSSVPAAAGRGLRPRVFSAHRPWPWPQLQVQDSVMGRRPIAGIAYIQTGPATHSFFKPFSQSGEPRRRLEHKIALHKLRQQARCAT